MEGVPAPHVLLGTCVSSQHPAELSTIPTMEGWAANRKTWPLVPRSAQGSQGHKQGLQVSTESACPSFRIQNSLEHFPRFTVTQM